MTRAEYQMKTKQVLQTSYYSPEYEWFPRELQLEDNRRRAKPLFSLEGRARPYDIQMKTSSAEEVHLEDTASLQTAWPNLRRR